eukprot:8714401-Alexandrium_andersonii.AAC.1
MGPPGTVAGEAARRATCRLRAAVLGPEGSTALLVEARPADEGGRPAGRPARYISAVEVEAGAWLRG